MHETWLYQHFDIYFAKTDVYPLTGSILNSTKQKKPFTYKSYVVSRKAVSTTSLTKSRALQRAQSQLWCSPGYVINVLFPLSLITATQRSRHAQGAQIRL